MPQQQFSYSAGPLGMHVAFHLNSSWIVFSEVKRICRTQRRHRSARTSLLMLRPTCSWPNRSNKTLRAIKQLFCRSCANTSKRICTFSYSIWTAHTWTETSSVMALKTYILLPIRRLKSVIYKPLHIRTVFYRWP